MAPLSEATSTVCPGLGANEVYRPLELSAVLMPLDMAFAAELGLADPARAEFMLLYMACEILA